MVIKSKEIIIRHCTNCLQDEEYEEGDEYYEWAKDLYEDDDWQCEFCTNKNGW